MAAMANYRRKLLAHRVSSRDGDGGERVRSCVPLGASSYITAAKVWGGAKPA